MPPPRTEPWWRSAVVYQVYPRSFADADGDGEGDLRGITSRLDHLVALGVDALWISPWYPSPMADGGYDVADYRDIDPRFGTLEDADELLRSAHDRGLRVIIDLVPNHTSVEHPWFQAALASGPGSPERARYLFRDGRGPRGEEPPNNWISAFGSTAWTRVTGPDGLGEQWYHHTFGVEQPDLDWLDPGVREEFDAILRFWLDRGVDGFRLDAVPAMAKAEGLPDADYDDPERFASAEWVDNPHWDVDGVHEILRRWRSVLDEYPGDRVFVAEAVVRGPDRLARYLRPDELHTAFDFDYMHSPWDASSLRSAIRNALSTLAAHGAPATWALSSHDEVRHVTRYGKGSAAALMGQTLPGTTDLELGERRARAAVLLTLALPGSIYLYQGEELGLPEVDDLPDEVLQDPVFRRSGGRLRGRDGCRVPLPWSGSTPPFGFSPNGTPTWLPQPPQWRDLTVAAQASRPDSMLMLYRSALALRRKRAELRAAPLVWRGSRQDVLDLQRGSRFRCVVNLGTTDVPLPAAPALTSLPGLDRVLPPDTAAWILS